MKYFESSQIRCNDRNKFVPKPTVEIPTVNFELDF